MAKIKFKHLTGAILGSCEFDFINDIRKEADLFEKKILEDVELDNNQRIIITACALQEKVVFLAHITDDTGIIHQYKGIDDWGDLQLYLRQQKEK